MSASAMKWTGSCLIMRKVATGLGSCTRAGSRFLRSEPPAVPVALPCGGTQRVNCAVQKFAARTRRWARFEVFLLHNLHNLVLVVTKFTQRICAALFLLVATGLAWAVGCPQLEELAAQILAERGHADADAPSLESLRLNTAFVDRIAPKDVNREVSHLAARLLSDVIAKIDAKDKDSVQVDPSGIFIIGSWRIGVTRPVDRNRSRVTARNVDRGLTVAEGEAINGTEGFLITESEAVGFLSLSKRKQDKREVESERNGCMNRACHAHVSDAGRSRDRPSLTIEGNDWAHHELLDPRDYNVSLDKIRDALESMRVELLQAI